VEQKSEHLNNAKGFCLLSYTPSRMRFIRCLCPNNQDHQEILWIFKIERETWKNKYLQEDDQEEVANPILKQL